MNSSCGLKNQAVQSLIFYRIFKRWKDKGGAQDCRKKYTEFPGVKRKEVDCKDSRVVSSRSVPCLTLVQMMERLVCEN